MKIYGKWKNGFIVIAKDDKDDLLLIDESIKFYNQNLSKILIVYIDLIISNENIKYFPFYKK